MTYIIDILYKILYNLIYYILYNSNLIILKLLLPNNHFLFINYNSFNTNYIVKLLCYNIVD